MLTRLPVFTALVLVLALFPLHSPAAPGETPAAPLSLEGAFNLRDLGGYAAQDGRIVKRGMVFRADALNRLTDADLAALAPLGLKTIVDFRTEAEKKAAPHRVPAGVSRVLEVPVNPGNMSGLRDITPEEAAQIMPRLNRKLVNEHTKEYALFFSHLAEYGESPLLFNCSAGKDRTGLAAALFLSALGVDKETVFRDYLESARHITRKYADEIAARPWLAPLFTVKREYLEAAFEEIDARHGGMDNYLVKELGVDVELLRRRYLEDRAQP